MTPEQWEKLQTCFGKAISLDERALADYLQELGAEAPDIIEDLKRLLKEDASDDEALLRPVADAAAALDDSLSDPWLGRQFGNYVAQKKIATGGMSAVYQGVRNDDEFEQTVAIKIVANHFSSAELNTRFKTERQILASLHHPNIAELYDGGTTDEGLPFLIMEYIDGEHIDVYCDKHKLSIDERLTVFGKITDAVDYAHKNLVVHRDIKPSNIIVTAEGVPKLLDFGIAKPLKQESIGQTIAVTRADVRAMTPEYASPEQVRGEAITTATDVYSLGVLLYKLLCGRMPYLLSATSVAAVAHAICDSIPSRPSTAVTISADDQNNAPDIVALRNTSVARLQRTLTGDLDNIVLATLKKDPERRYPSARALADDIRRYQANEPISARPDSITYRLRKFAHRHQFGVVASLAGLLLVVGLVSFYTWQVTTERNRAEAQARKAEQVVDFLSGVFASVSPFETNGIEPTVREVLKRGVDSIDRSLADQPEIQADLLRRLGIIHDDLGLLDQAQTLIDKSIDISRKLYGDDDARTVSAFLARASAHRSAGEFEQALALGKESLAIALAHSPQDPELIGHAHHVVGNTQSDLGDYRASIESNEEALSLYSSLGVDAQEAYALVLNDIAYAYMRLDEYDTALRLGNEAHDRTVKALGRIHPAVTVNLAMLSRVHQMRGELDQAEEQLREMVNIAAPLYGREHPQYADSMATLAQFLSAQQRWEETEALLLQVLSIYENGYGESHYRTSDIHAQLGEVYSETGRHEQALDYASKALALSIDIHGPKGWRTAINYAEYADALLEARRDGEAVAAFYTSVDAFQANQRGLATAYTQAKLARALLAAGDIDAAATSVAEAETAVRAIGPPPGNGILRRIRVASSEVAVAQGRYDDAAISAARAMESFGENPERPTVWYWQTQLVLAKIEHAAGRSDVAKRKVMEIVSGLKRENGTQSRAEQEARLFLEQIER